LKIERESQFNTAGGSEFQVRGAAVLNNRLANDVCRNGTHSSGMDDDQKFDYLSVKLLVQKLFKSLLFKCEVISAKNYFKV